HAQHDQAGLLLPGTSHSGTIRIYHRYSGWLGCANRCTSKFDYLAGGVIHMVSLKTDKVTLEIINNYYTAIAEGMAYTLERTAHTTFIKETGDYGTAIATPDGEFFAYSRHSGVSSNIGLNVGEVIRFFDHYEPGDVVITNDPYNTGGLVTHLPDIHLLKPIFHNGELL